jgi:hypothetical protein
VRPERFGAGHPKICNDNSQRVGTGERQVDRQISSVTRLAATALLVGLAVLGCARQGGNEPGRQADAPAAGSALSSQVVQAAPTLAPTDAPTPAAMVSPTPSGSAAPATNAPAQTDAPAATPDPLDGQLANINNLLNGINSSIAGSDAGPASGE